MKTLPKKSPPNSILHTIDLENEYAIPRQTGANWRLVGKGPPYIRVSSRLILYRREDVEKWLAERTVTPGRAAG